MAALGGIMLVMQRALIKVGIFRMKYPMRNKLVLAMLSLITTVALNVNIGRAQTSNMPQLTASYPEVNVREGPGLNYTSFDIISNDSTVYPILGRHDGWWLISMNPVGATDVTLYDSVGWVDGKYVTATHISSVPVVGTCAFAVHIMPQCPAGQDVIKLTYQAFEHGFMLWFPSSQIIGVYTVNPQDDIHPVFYITDTWSGETLPKLAPPAGLQQPQNGFGKVWLDDNLQQTLGWAKTGEVAYITRYETNYLEGADPHTGADYLCLPQGQIIQESYLNEMWAFVDNGNRSACHL
jgi:hypothetical protein